MKPPCLTPLIALSLAASFALKAEDVIVAKAQKAAMAWLSLTDQASYGKSWDEAATLFKGAITKAAWESALAAARQPLGSVLSRRQKSAALTHSLPGAPDGSYVVIQFETRFEGQASAIETITPMLDKDGSWRVSGYFIR